MSDACDKCANHMKVSSFCLYCKADVCGECKERCISQGHNIRQISREEMKSPVCKEHGKPFVTFCKPCQKPCCGICIARKHARHSFMTIDDAAKDARSKLKISLQSQDSTTLPKLQTARKLLDDGFEKYTEAMDCALEKSKARFQSLRQELERNEEDWIRNLENTRTDDVAKMNIMKGNLDNQIRYKDQFIDNCQAILSDGSDAMVLAFASDINDAESIDVSRVVLPSPVNFKPSSRRLSSADDLIGMIQRPRRHTAAHISFYCSVVFCILLILISIAVQPNEKALNADMIEFKLLKTIENTKGYSIVHTDQNEVWISDQQRKTLSLYDSDFNVIRKTYLGLPVKDIVLTMAHDILATDLENRRVLRISRSGNVKTFMDTSPYRPWGIAINDKEQIVVGQYTYNTVLGNLYRLAMYSSVTSTELGNIRIDETGRPFFNDIATQVKQNGNGDYIVSLKNEVVCFTRMGIYKWKYITTKVSKILGLVCDRYNNIIIAEESNRQITILKSNGKLLKNLYTEGINGPISLSIDTVGNLWVGAVDHIKVIRYLK